MSVVVHLPTSYMSPLHDDFHLKKSENFRTDPNVSIKNSAEKIPLLFSNEHSFGAFEATHWPHILSRVVGSDYKRHARAVQSLNYFDLNFFSIFILTEIANNYIIP